MSVQPSARLAVEQLDQRDVPAVFNLTTAGSQAVTSGFIAQQIDGAPIQDFTRFVRFAGGSIEQGYNTTGNSQFDEIRGPNIHPALTLGQIPTVTIGGVTYREFILNIHQSILSPRLSVDELQIFTASGSNLHNYRPGQDELRGATRVFDMDAGPNHTILLNGNLNRGQGWGDMRLLVPNANFAGASDGTFVYLYSRLGATNGARANGGPEAWAVRDLPEPPPPPPPPPTGGTLSGFLFVDRLDLGTRGMKDAGEGGIADVTVFLNGFDANGDDVTLTTETDAIGFYSFNAPVGTSYTITFDINDTDLVGTVNALTLENGKDYIGSLNEGTAGNDTLSGITVDAGVQGINYNFTWNPPVSG